MFIKIKSPSISPGSNCIYNYNNSKQCCPGIKCDQELDSSAKCVAKGQTLFAGQKIRDPENYCRECFCQDNGQLECQSIDCGFNKVSFILGILEQP